jgi:hypothetical protein
MTPPRAAGVAAHNRYSSSGPAEDNLGMYLRWFRWPRRARRSNAPGTAMAGAEATNGRCSVRRRSLFAEPRPSWDYWEGKWLVVDAESLYSPEVISGLVLRQPE